MTLGVPLAVIVRVPHRLLIAINDAISHARQPRNGRRFLPAPPPLHSFLRLSPLVTIRGGSRTGRPGVHTSLESRNPRSLPGLLGDVGSGFGKGDRVLSLTALMHSLKGLCGPRRLKRGVSCGNKGSVSSAPTTFRESFSNDEPGLFSGMWRSMLDPIPINSSICPNIHSPIDLTRVSPGWLLLLLGMGTWG